MNTALTADSRVAKFCALVNQGLQAWVHAGELLNEMVRDDPLVIQRIVRDNPHLTRDILEAFQRIGRKEVMPILMVDASPGARLLAGLSYEEQQRVYASGVKIVRQTSSGPVERKCHVSDLSTAEAKRVFDLDRIRSPREQRELLPKPRVNMIRERVPDQVIMERAALDAADPSVAMDEPRKVLEAALNNAHLSLMQARDALFDIKPDHPMDAHISVALGAVGKLRFALNDSQI